MFSIQIISQLWKDFQKISQPFKFKFAESGNTLCFILEPCSHAAYINGSTEVGISESTVVYILSKHGWLK